MNLLKKHKRPKEPLMRKLDMPVQLQMKIQRHYCPLISKTTQLITTTRLKFTEKFNAFVFCDTSLCSYSTGDSQCKCKQLQCKPLTLAWALTIYK